MARPGLRLSALAQTTTDRHCAHGRFDPLRLRSRWLRERSRGAQDRRRPAGAIVVALTFHVFMLAGMAGDYPAHGDAMGGMTGGLGVASAPASQPEEDAHGGHMMAGCCVVLATLGLVVLLKKVEKNSAAVAPSWRIAAPPSPSTARRLHRPPALWWPPVSCCASGSSGVARVWRPRGRSMPCCRAFGAGIADVSSLWGWTYSPPPTPMS